MSTRPDSVPPVSQASAPTVDQAPVGRSTHAVARNAFHLLLGQVGTTALAILLAACLGRCLGASDFGLYYLLTSTSNFAYVVVEWGQSPYVIAEVARNRDRAGTLLGTSVVLRVVGALVIAALSSVTLALLGYDRRTCWLAALFIVTFLPFFLIQAYAMIFRGFERMDLEASATVVNKVLVLGLTAAAFAAHAGLGGALIAQGIAGLGSLAMAAWLFRRLRVRHLRAHLQDAREVIVGGTPIVAATLTSSATLYLEVVCLSKFSPVESVGFYGAARNIFGTIVSIAAILGTAAFPGLSRAAGDTKEFRRELASAMRPLLGIAALATVGSYLFADVAVGIVFGRARFAQAAFDHQGERPGSVLAFHRLPARGGLGRNRKSQAAGGHQGIQHRAGTRSLRYAHPAVAESLRQWWVGCGGRQRNRRGRNVGDDGRDLSARCPCRLAAGRCRQGAGRERRHSPVLPDPAPVHTRLGHTQLCDCISRLGCRGRSDSPRRDRRVPETLVAPRQGLTAGTCMRQGLDVAATAFALATTLTPACGRCGGAPSLSSDAGTADLQVAADSARGLGPIAAAYAVSRFIVVDQFGYRPGSEKVAVIRSPRVGADAGDSFAPGRTYAVVDANSGSTMFEATPAAWKGGATDRSSGDAAWWVDFSSVAATGAYFVLDEERKVRSPVFRIAEGVYRDVLAQAMRTFYYQRDGTAKPAAFAGQEWADGVAHPQDAQCALYSNGASPKDLHGGWFDAGDQNRYTSQTATYVIELLRAFVENPSAFGDDYRIPESGNGIPDVLDEVKWAVDWLSRMQNDDGSVLTIAVHAGASPPSSDTSPCRYGPASTSATLTSAAALAYASLVFASVRTSDGTYAQYARDLQSRATRA